MGTRGSPLARWQAEWVRDQLEQRRVSVELIVITTTGDVTSTPLVAGGGQGLFTKELQRALLDGQIDLAVHSLKDLPTEVVPGLCLGAVPKREDVADALVVRAESARNQEAPPGLDVGSTTLPPIGPVAPPLANSLAAALAGLPTGARVGTGSRRRRSQLLYQRPDLIVTDIRGNVDTRLRKLDAGEFDAIVLATAGLTRLGFAERISQRLPPPTMLPAVGQGALGLEVREADDLTRAAVALLDDPATQAAVTAERALLAGLRAGCLAPVGAWARFEAELLRLDAVVLTVDGSRRLAASAAGRADEAAAIGSHAATQLLSQGARELIDSAHTPTI